MSDRLNDEWQLQPLGGETGQSYKGVRGQDAIFLKRNATPFLAAASSEGITPKMLWTRRTIHGEELTAQEWIDARLLTAHDMVQMDVLELIKYVHQSSSLANMLKHINGAVAGPQEFLQMYQDGLQKDLQSHHFLNYVYRYLEESMEALEEVEVCVCHGDLNHRNFLLEESGRLYLVDWEMVKLADPLSDIAAILCQYVDKKDWLTWIKVYGMEIDKQVLARLEWYALHHCLMMVKRSHFHGRYHQMNQSILLIKAILGTNKG